MPESSRAYADSSHRRVFVENAHALLEPVGHLSGLDAIGVDLEMGQRVERRPGGVQEWKHILALIQIASDQISLVIDPLRCDDLSPLASMMAGPTRKVFLGGGQDVALLAQAGIPAFNIVDVGEVALGIWGRREDGMAALARRMFGVSLDKTVRRADWLVRPLNPALLTYAYQDAELTLLIYRWMQDHYPVELRAHERRELDPPLPEGAASWLQGVMRRSPSDAILVLSEFGLEAERNADQLERDIRVLFSQSLSPRQLARLIRVSAEYQLTELLPDISLLAGSPTSLVRSAVARALGTMGNLESSTPVLEGLRADSVEDVRKTAEISLKELKKPTQAAAPDADAESPSISIDAGTLSALKALKQELERSEE